MQDLAPALPFLTPLETRVPAHEFRQEWVELIFGPEVELEGVHEGDKRLIGRKGISMTSPHSSP